MACFVLYDYEDSLKSSDLVLEDAPCLFNLFNIDDPEVGSNCEGVKVKEVDVMVEDESMMKESFHPGSESTDALGYVPDSCVVPDSLGDVDTFVPETCPDFLEFDARMEELDREANRRILATEERRKRVEAMNDTPEHKRWFILEISKYFPAFMCLLEDLERPFPLDFWQLVCPLDILVQF